MSAHGAAIILSSRPPEVRRSARPVPSPWRRRSGTGPAGHSTAARAAARRGHSSASDAGRRPRRSRNSPTAFWWASTASAASSRSRLNFALSLHRARHALVVDVLPEVRGGVTLAPRGEEVRPEAAQPVRRARHLRGLGEDPRGLPRVVEEEVTEEAPVLAYPPGRAGSPTPALQQGSTAFRGSPAPTGWGSARKIAP